MDEIALVRSFRSAVPDGDSAARDRARRLLWQERRRRRVVRSRRVWILAAAVLAGIAVVSSASGWTSRLFDAIAGEPAPPPVRQAFAVRNDARARQAMPIFRDSPAMEVITERTHGVMGIHTSVGQVIIWSAPTKGGGTCEVIDIVRLRRPGGVPNGGGGCSPSPLPPDVPLHAGFMRTRVGDAYLELVHAKVSVGVGSVELRYPDGRAEILPVFERQFLSELRTGSRPSLIIARDSKGNEIERREIRAGIPVGPGMTPEPIGPERVVIRLDTSAGYPLTFSVAPAKGGQVCQITKYRGSVGRSCGPDRRERVRADEISVHPGLWNEAEDGKPLVSLNGVVGSNIARLEVHYADGAVEPVPVTERFVYFEIPPAHHKDKRFVLVARDRDGEEIARRVIN